LAKFAFEYDENLIGEMVLKESNLANRCLRGERLESAKLFCKEMECVGAVDV
jgi:hypothetical protein